MKKKILVTGLLAVTSVFMFLSACGKKSDNVTTSSAKTESSKVVVDNKPASSLNISSTVTPAGAIKPEYTSPLSGKALDKKYKNKRPFRLYVQQHRICLSTDRNRQSGHFI